MINDIIVFLCVNECVGLWDNFAIIIVNSLLSGMYCLEPQNLLHFHLYRNFDGWKCQGNYLSRGGP